MNIPETVWKVYRAEQARLRRLELLAKVALGNGSTAYVQVERRRFVLRRRVRRLELLLARVYKRIGRKLASFHDSQDALGAGQSEHGPKGAQEVIA